MMTYVLYHEMMHEWIGQQIIVKNAELNYWFSEGFTDYYSSKMRLKSGNLTFEEWLKWLSDKTNEYDINPHKNEPNYVLQTRWVEDAFFDKIPYLRGTLYAFYLDNFVQLKTKGKFSLDDVLFEIHSKVKSKDELFTDEIFLDALNKFIPNEDCVYEFQKHIQSAIQIDFSNVQLIEGIKFENGHFNSVRNLSNKFVK
jgi:predicted metalloprotease with PDZ domain